MATKKKILVALAAFFIVAMGAIKIHSANSDIWSVQGLGTLWNKDVAHVDVSGNFRLYNGSIFLGDIGTTPTTTNLFSVKIPFFNGGGASTAIGTIVIASATATTPGIGSFGALLATTTVVGVADGMYANGTVGYMTISGYALVLTTGPVSVGDLIVTTGTVAGFGGTSGATATNATVLGKALSRGTAAGGTTLVLVNPQ